MDRIDATILGSQADENRHLGAACRSFRYGVFLGEELCRLGAMVTVGDGGEALVEKSLETLDSTRFMEAVEAVDIPVGVAVPQQRGRRARDFREEVFELTFVLGQQHHRLGVDTQGLEQR